MVLRLAPLAWLFIGEAVQQGGLEPVAQVDGGHGGSLRQVVVLEGAAGAGLAAALLPPVLDFHLGEGELDALHRRAVLVHGQFQHGHARAAQRDGEVVDLLLAGPAHGAASASLTSSLVASALMSEVLALSMALNTVRCL